MNVDIAAAPIGFSDRLESSPEAFQICSFILLEALNKETMNKLTNDGLLGI